ncbi:response regulator [Corallincola luteus]|uniref:Response regulator n=1 Tax=Corallincola luteus TaxID=1775177 RepID=A0ABY2ARD2_9GAMM|nr:response regulator [Corallincola luteus]TCI04641.1 response regulator [Corallincola luteus]
METINIVCVDDQPEVLDAVIKDLSTLAVHFNIEEAESADECLDLLDELEARGELVGLVISDHVMPGTSGVDLLGQISEDGRFAHTKKILLTGQATHKDTINAINAARIDHYFEKPWQVDELTDTCRRLLTEFILDQGLDYEEILPALDQPTLYKKLKG